MIFRTIHNRDNPYFQLNRAAVNDERLSYKAVGIHTYLMSKPDGWEANEADIISRHSEGREAVRTGIRELIDCGYMHRTRITDELGKVIKWQIDVYETPDVNPHFNPQSDFPIVDKPESGFPQSGKPECGFPTRSKYIYSEKEEGSETPPPSATPKANEYLPGLPDPRKRQSQASRLAAQTTDVAKLGIDAKQFRLIVDEILRGMGKLELATHDESTLNEAQDVARCLVALDARYRTPSGVKVVFDTWYGNNEFDGNAPYAKQVKSYASQILAGKVKTKQETTPVVNWSNYGGGPLKYMEE